jgi:hypothetical protein
MGEHLVMKKTPIAPIIASICALLVLTFEFVAISVISGEFRINGHLPLNFSEEASILNLVESTLSLMVPALLTVFCVFMMVEECRKASSVPRIKHFLKLLALPILLMIVSALQKTVYLLIYEGNFTLDYTWGYLLISAVLFVLYAMAIYMKLKTGFLLAIACLVCIVIEVIRFSFLNLSYAYVSGSTVYISTFASAVLFYLTYLFLSFSIIFYRRKEESLSESK